MLNRFSLVLLLCAGVLYGNPWVMFSDGQDTYIYNQKNGEVYVRFRRGGANYEDVFIKMPQGIKNQNGNSSTRANPNDALPLKPTQSEREEFLKRALELQNGIYTPTNEP